MRLHFIFAFLVIILLIVSLHYTRPYKFTFENVQAMAESLSKKDYDATQKIDPESLKILQNLTVDQANDIRWQEQATLWRKKLLPFQIKFWHLGPWHLKPVQINTVERRRVVPLGYSPNFFDFGANHFEHPLPPDLGYAGFRIHYPLNRPNYLDEVGSFLGASYYRIIAKDQWYGLSCRGLSLDTTVLGKDNKMGPEEFPDFTDFWLVEPSSNSTTLQVYALMQSPSVTGAYSFKIQPGVESIVDVQFTLFVRKKVKRFGIAPLTSMYLFGENSREHVNDIHPEIHDSDGLLMEDGKGEWLWRPLQTRPNFQEYYFQDENPKGFGLLQRDRDFQHYQDLEAYYQKRPCIWTEPKGDWGKGFVELLQNNSTDVNQDNVIMLWSPEKTPEPGQRIDLSYRQTFFSQDDRFPPLATVKQMFVNTPPPEPPPAPKPPVSGAPKPAPAATVRTGPAVVGPMPPDQKNCPHIVLDFIGNGINLTKDSHPALGQIPAPDVESNPPGKITNVTIVPNPEENAWRLSFDIVGAEPQHTVELSGRLLLNDKPFSETWTYTWYPADTTPAPPITKKTMSSAKLITENHEAWHEAYHRLRLYLDTYGLYDSIHTAEISLSILRQALEVHATTPEVAPTTVTLQVAKQMLQEWLGGILKDEALPRAQTLPIGHVALLLSQVPQRWSTSFLTHPLPEQLTKALQRSVMVTGPTLDVSSMTPRDFDYGPMLQIARQTWHQWDVRRFVEAALFWSGVYAILYYSLYIYLYGLPQ